MPPVRFLTAGIFILKDAFQADSVESEKQIRTEMKENVFAIRKNNKANTNPERR